MKISKETCALLDMFEIEPKTVNWLAEKFSYEEQILEMALGIPECRRYSKKDFFQVQKKLQYLCIRFGVEMVQRELKVYGLQMDRVEQEIRNVKLEEEKEAVYDIKLRQLNVKLEQLEQQEEEEQRETMAEPIEVTLRHNDDCQCSLVFRGMDVVLAEDVEEERKDVEMLSPAPSQGHESLGMEAQAGQPRAEKCPGNMEAEERPAREVRIAVRGRGVSIQRTMPDDVTIRDIFRLFDLPCSASLVIRSRDVRLGADCGKRLRELDIASNELFYLE